MFIKTKSKIIHLLLNIFCRRFFKLRPLMNMGDVIENEPETISAAKSVSKQSVDRKLEILDHGWGHSDSKQMRLAVDSAHRPIPWYTYPAIEYIRQLDFSGANIFEWGSGYSSLYWSSVSRSVISVENNAEWHEKIVKQASDNLDIHLIRDCSAYEDKVLSYDKFDVIIIDGIRRQECAKNAIKKIRNGGLIILDNSDWYVQAAETLRNLGLVQIDMSGFGPINDYTWSTSLYFHGDFMFKPIGSRLPMHGVGSLDTIVDEVAE